MKPSAARNSRFHAARWVGSLGQTALCLGMLSGCHGLFWWKHDRAADEAELTATAEIPASPAVPTVNRRILIVARGPHGVDGGPHLEFARDLVAAFNKSGSYEAILAPPGIPIPCPGDADPPIILPVEGPIPGVDYDEMLVVEMTDLQPFRPLRLSAVVELRAAGDGHLLSRSYRTWNGPEDLEPLYPHPLTRKKLWHPAPLGMVEQNELSRLSPRAFFQNVATEIVQEIAGAPH